MPKETTLQSTLGLNRNEIEILLRLVAWGSLAREQVPAMATCGHRSVKLSSVNTIVRGLRKKLAAHDIALVTIRDFGFGLGQKDRDRIVAFIGPREVQGVSAEAAGAKFRQRDSMEPKAAADAPTTV